MRILIPCNKEYIVPKNRNPFILTIYSGLLKRGYEVICDNNEFWNDPTNYDVIYFQWPEATFNWNDFDALRFKCQLTKIKGKGIKIVATCHNLHAHSNNSEANKLYDTLYSFSDVIHHLGNYSYSLFKKKYPKCIHFISQHPVFYDVKSMNLDMDDCRNKLLLPINKKIILAFGEFRNEDEINMLLSLRKKLSNQKILIVAPSLKLNTGRLFNGLRFDKTLKCIYKRINYRSLYCNKGFVDENIIPYYLSACDLVFIQRKEILNSGNLPLAFSAGKIVVGPNKGNVGDILNSTNNPCFNPESLQDIIEKTKMGLKLSENSDIGIRNYEYAKKYMNPFTTNDIIANQLSRLISN